MVLAIGGIRMLTGLPDLHPQFTLSLSNDYNGPPGEHLFLSKEE